MTDPQNNSEPPPDQGPGSTPPLVAIDDPYSANPILEDMRSRDAAHFDALQEIAPPPRLFAGGTADLPSFTSSGIDPKLLLQLPYGIRHHAAAEPDVAAVHALFEQFAHTPDAVIKHPGLDDAWQRVEQWFDQEADARTPEQRQADDDATYALFYNAENDDATYLTEQRRRRQAGEPPLPPKSTR
jgi:hypothetical protein